MNPYGQWELYESPQDAEKGRAEWRANNPASVPPGLQGRAYLGGNRYGLNPAEQGRVANRALGEAQYGTNTNVLNQILHNLNANGEGVFDRSKYPLLGQMMDNYLANNNSYNSGALDLSGQAYSPVAGTPDVRTWAGRNPTAYGQPASQVGQVLQSRTQQPNSSYSDQIFGASNPNLGASMDGAQQAQSSQVGNAMRGAVGGNRRKMWQV